VIPTTADYLRALCDGWEDFDDDARGWEKTMDNLVAAARLHLAPPLTEDDPPTTVRAVLRPGDVLGLIVLVVVVAWWAYLGATSAPPSTTRDTAPAPWTPATSGPPVEVEVPGAPTSEEAP
jgi:hypothetical protein